MFESRHRSSGSANRWLIVAGAGLVILAFVARMLLDIGNTKVSDLAAALRPDSATATVPAPVPALVADPVPTPPPVLKLDTTSRAGGYTVQIGAFGSEANATKLSQRAAALGYAASVVAQPRSGSTLYLVRVKGLGANEARQASDSLARTLGVKSVVIPPGRQDR